MGVKPAVFVSAGQRSSHYIPGGYSRRNYVPNLGGGLSAGNVCILGESRAGKPMELHVFKSANDARTTLESGTGLDAVIHAFSPGGGLVPQQIGFMRVNNGTQSSRTIQKTGSDVYGIKSYSYGVPMNQVKVKFVAGTVAGSYQIVSEYKGDQYINDNILRKSFNVLYTGAGTACAMDIDGDSLTTTVTGATDTLTIDLTSFRTISELVNYINDQATYTATVLTDDPMELSVDLDEISTVDIKTAEYEAKSNYQAIYEALGINGFISDVTKLGTARIIPDVDSDFVYLTGATDGLYTTSEWNTALSALEIEDIQLISTPVTTEAIHILIRNHCNTMNSVTGKNERQFYVGGAIGEDKTAVKTRASNLNSEYGSLCYPGLYAYNDSSVKTLYSPAIYACKQVGALSCLNMNNPTTFKTVDTLGWERNIGTSELEELIEAGVLCGGKKPDGSYVTIRSMTTYQGALLQKNEASMMRESLYMSKDLRTSLETALTGQPLLGNESLITVDSMFRLKINEWYSQGLIVKGPDQAELFWGYVRSINGDTIQLEYNTYDTAPLNFSFVTSNHNVLVTTAQ